MFNRFSAAILRHGASGVGNPQFKLGCDEAYELQYIPFEHVNREAKLVIVGITPGNTQLELAYGKAQELMAEGLSAEQILLEVKKVGAFGGPSMRPNLLKILRHFEFDRLLGIADVESLWGANADLLESTSVVPHAAFKAGKPFKGSFSQVMSSPLLRECFLDCFVTSVREMSSQALFVGLGPCPQAALEWCAQQGVLRREQVLGAFCHPSSAGGSTTRYFVREVKKEDLSANNPVRDRTEWLDQAYTQMRANTTALLAGVPYPTSTPLAALKEAPAIVVRQPDRKASPPVRIEQRSPIASGHSELAAIVARAQQLGCRITNVTAKMTELCTSEGHTVYLVNESSRMNRIRLVLHPQWSSAELEALPGVAQVGSRHLFNSNLKRFPKRVNSGVNATAHGWPVTVDTLLDFERTLLALDKAGNKQESYSQAMP